MNAPIRKEMVTVDSNANRQVSMGFANAQSFELMQRAAKLLSNSTLVPTAYRAWDEKKGENPSAMSNCVVALNMSSRMGADPLMVMQNLYIVEGRPSWSSQWIIAAINGCGRFSPLRFDLKELGQQEVEYTVVEWVDRQRVNKKMKATIQNLECTAWAIERETGARIDSPKVSVEMAVKEGWYGKNGSKWQTMPEVMLRYRTASFFGKLYAPELLMGLQTTEEMHDIIDLNPDGSVGGITSESAPARKPAVTMPQARETQAADVIDPDTGEIQPAAQPTQAAAADPAPAEPKKPPVEYAAGALATEGERKLILTRAKNNGLEIYQLMDAAGMSDVELDLGTLEGLTKDGFVALRDQLPKAQ
jgi:hypothetical protein